MRRSRVVLASSLAVLVLLGVGVALAGSGSAAAGSGSAVPAKRALAAARAPQLPRALSEQLRQFLARRARPARPSVVVPRNLPVPGSTVCFVAAGSCSVTPCIEFAGGS